MTKARIDVHQHVVPKVWVEALADNGGDPSGWKSPKWSPEAALDFMDSQEIATGVLSLTAPSVAGWTGEARRKMASSVNDYTAGLVVTQPARFGNFVTLPLPDLDGALIELERCYAGLRPDGVVLLSNYHGHYLGDRIFEPLWQELDRRNAVVFIHPGKPGISVMDGIPGPVVDYPFDTTRTAVQLVLNGVISRYRNVKIILSHGGGFLPYASHRFAELACALNPTAGTVEGAIEDFKTFYFDTALSSSSASLPSLMAFAKPGHVLFGSDFPYAPPAVGASFAKMLDAFEGFKSGELESLNRAAALKLFPRLA